MGGLDGREVAGVASGDSGVAEAFSAGDGGCVDDVDSVIGVGGDELEHSLQVAGGVIDRFEPAGGDTQTALVTVP